MSIYVGIDVHRKRSQVAVIDQDGQVLANRNVPNGAEPILKVIGGLPPGTPAAFEACYGTSWLVELLEDYGFAPHLVHPSRCKAIASARLKNDKGRRRDLGPAAAGGPAARSLDRPAAGAGRCGRCCATGWRWCGCGPGCATGSAPSWPTTGMTGRPAGTGPARARPGSPRSSCPRSSAGWPGITRGLIDALQDRIDRLDWEIHQRARSDPRVKVLTQLPGVGPFTALVILAEVGDISRFASARKLASWAGLTPTVRGSDRVAHYGHISKEGSVWLRWVLCEAAQTAKRSPEFAPAFQRIAKRRGKKIATTAVARKLATRAWHLLTETDQAAAPQPTAPRMAPGELEDLPEPGHGPRSSN
jgi:transposase